MKQTIILGSDSSFVLDTNFQINGQDKSQVKWAYITTAGNDVPDDSYLVRTKAALDNKTWDYHEYDISGKSDNEISEFLKDKDAIFMQGGNTYYLLKQIRQSNFKEALKKFLADGKVYVGTSAGSYIMCPDTDMMNWKDSSRFNKNGITDLTAFGFVPFQVFCHLNRHQEQEKEIKKYASLSPYKVYFLNDGEGLLVEDSQVIKLIK
ncbi:peptidase E [Patescibacteria group bacterium]|nr:peptidase E [Patescibacteria group bacterium]